MEAPSSPVPGLSPEEWAAAAAQLPVSVVVVDLEARVLSWNTGAEALYGWAAEEALGRPVSELIPVLPDALALADEVMQQTYGGEDWQGEFTTRHRHGHRLVVRVNNRPLHAADGSVTGVVGVSMDLSAYRAAIEAREAQVELARGQAQRLADRNSRLIEISESLSSALTAEQVVTAVLGQGVTALGAAAGGVVLVEDGHLRRLGSVGYESHVAAAYDGLSLDVRSSLTDVVRTGRPLRFGSAQELAARYPGLPHSALSRSFAGVPLVVDGRVIGAMALSASVDDAFPDEEMAFLETLGRHCAQALERGRLFAAERATRERMAFLAMASERLAASLDVAETLDVVAALAVPELGDWCSVHTLDEQGNPQLVTVHHRDPERGVILRDLFDRYPPEPDRGAGVGQAVGEHRLVHHRTFPEAALRAIARDDEHMEGLRKLRLGSALVVPLAVPTRTLGVLTIVRDEQDAYDEADIDLVRDLARRMATAVDNALRFRQERQTAVTLQRSLLPRVLPALPGLRFAHRYLPGAAGSAVGGDWYDVLPLPGGLVGLVIGDVMGRGVEAAAVMGQLRAALRAYAMVEPEPAAVLGLLDAAVGSLEQTAITTCLYGVLRPGHPPAAAGQRGAPAAAGGPCGGRWVVHRAGARSAARRRLGPAADDGGRAARGVGAAALHRRPRRGPPPAGGGGDARAAQRRGGRAGAGRRRAVRPAAARDRARRPARRRQRAAGRRPGSRVEPPRRPAPAPGRPPVRGAPRAAPGRRLGGGGGRRPPRRRAAGHRAGEQRPAARRARRRHVAAPPSGGPALRGRGRPGERAAGAAGARRGGRGRPRAGRGARSGGPVGLRAPVCRQVRLVRARPRRPVKSREIRLAARPVGEPKPTDFELAEVDVPSPADGEVLVRNTWMSVDPYMRGRMNDTKSYVPPFQIGKALEGGAVGEVVESTVDTHAVGDLVLSNTGWREHAVGPAKRFSRVDRIDTPSHYLGVLGMPGLTAYAGLLRSAEYKDGETVFVSGAAGAVGSIVGQLVKLRGGTAIGSAGSPEKVAWLKEIGFDAAFDYHDGRVSDLLAAAAPDGIDCYFDNVGGEHLEAAINSLKVHGRAAICGMISVYNATEPTPAPRNMSLIIGKRLVLRGLLVGDHNDLTQQFRSEVGAAIADGRIQVRETVLEGIEHAADAFIGMLHGDNTGKMLVKL